MTSIAKQTEQTLVPPPEALLSELRSKAQQLSMLPAVANEALQLAKDPECSSEQFAAVVHRDVKLATDMLCLANSAVFSGGRPVASLQQAVTRLGFGQCRNLILTSSAMSLMKGMPLEQEWVRELLWRHSFTTATTCVCLNWRLGLGFVGDEFTAGLLHDVGRLLMALAAPDGFSAADPVDFFEIEDVIRREQEIIGYDHARFGAWFATENQLPESLVHAIQFHHEPETPHESQKLTALVAAADGIANHLQNQKLPGNYDPASNRGLLQLSKMMSRNLMEEVAEIEVELMEEIKREVQQ